MSKKILILSASPRKGGNSDALCDAFAKGAKEAGYYVEKIFLADKNIQYCRACEVCYTNGGVCIWKDDMKDILEKMVTSDVIVMASPVYFYTINAQMKTLIDRTVSRYTEIAGKDFYFFVTAADQDKEMLERSVECFRGFLDCVDDPVEKGVIYGAGLDQKGASKGSIYEKQAYEMGKNA